MKEILNLYFQDIMASSFLKQLCLMFTNNLDKWESQIICELVFLEVPK